MSTHRNPLALARLHAERAHLLIWELIGFECSAA